MGHKACAEPAQLPKSPKSPKSPKAWADPVEVPTAEQIEAALFASAPIVWSPLADAQDVAMRLKD